MAGARNGSGNPQVSKSGPSRGDAIFRLLAIIAVSFLFFVLGSWVTWRDVFPYREYLRNAFLGTQALIAGARISEAPLETGLWSRFRYDDQRRGVLELQRERTFPGLTLILVGESAHLVDLDGNIRHTWHLDIDRIVTPEERRRGMARASRIYWKPGRVFPNGDLMVMVDLKGITPQGVALVRLDRASRPLWIFHGKVHHDFDIAADGRIHVLGQALRASAPRPLRLRGPLIDERLYILSPDGRLLRDISILEAFARSPYAKLVNAIKGDARYEKGDYLHSNNVDIVDAATAARFGFVREGQVLLSLRELDTLAVMDVESVNIVWARRGSWHQQHDPDFLENGHLLLFDNQGDWERGGQSRVIEYDPATEAIVWQYSGPKGRELWSEWRSEQQRLQNGNTLINENEGGRLLEVTGGGDVVWEYICPFTNPRDERLVCHIMYAERYGLDQVPFSFNEGNLTAP